MTQNNERIEKWRHVTNLPLLPLYAVITSDQHCKDSSSIPLIMQTFSNWWEEMLKTNQIKQFCTAGIGFFGLKHVFVKGTV